MIPSGVCSVTFFMIQQTLGNGQTVLANRSFALETTTVYS